jgi:predicted component of type VI protein secretion system
MEVRQEAAAWQDIPPAAGSGANPRRERARCTMNVKLRIVQGRPKGKSLLFPAGEYVFGRGDECHVRPNSEWVSRQHCLLRVTSEGTFLRDLGSRNGTLVNGVRLVGERALGPGDQVQVGPLVFEVIVEEPVPGAPPHPATGEPHLLGAGTGDTALRAFDTVELEALKGLEPDVCEAPPEPPTAVTRAVESVGVRGASAPR